MAASRSLILLSERPDSLERSGNVLASDDDRSNGQKKE